jgi:hypothetical protein
MTTNSDKQQTATKAAAAYHLVGLASNNAPSAYRKLKLNWECLMGMMKQFLHDSDKGSSQTLQTSDLAVNMVPRPFLLEENTNSFLLLLNFCGCSMRIQYLPVNTPR